MIVLDEQIHKDQGELLQSWHFPVRQIGFDVGYAGMKDDQIITLLHSFRHSTLFTRDADFYKPRLRHNRYCIVYLDIEKIKVAEYARKVLRHPDFNTEAKRLGYLLRAAPDGLTIWEPSAEHSVFLKWLG